MTTIIFDLETGGLELNHPIIQIAAVAVSEFGKTTDEFQRKISFVEKTADPKALEINHYDPAVWAKEAMPLESVLREFARFLEPHKYLQCVSKAGKPYNVARLAAYNAQFDAPRLQKAFRDACVFLPADPRVLCILQLAMWEEWPGIERLLSFKLSDVADRLGIPTDGAHDALDDCKTAAEVMKLIHEGRRMRERA